MWAFGYLWWFGRGNSGRRPARRRNILSEVEMSRISIPAGYDDGGRFEREWARSTRYGRVRSDSEQRVRSAREVELEAEMRRLGMI